MDDLILRQAAIDALAAYMPALTTADGSAPVDHDIFVAQETCVDCMQIIHELPSAQSEQNDKPFSEMIHGMFDHIWDCQIDHPVFQDTVGDLMMAVIQCHKTLTEKKPEQKTGEWIKEDRGGVEYTAVCSKCGYATFWSDIEDFRYCPYCGKKMEK